LHAFFNFSKRAGCQEYLILVSLITSAIFGKVKLSLCFN
jgi:hypothetical protein